MYKQVNVLNLLHVAEPCELYCSDTDDTLIVPWGDSVLDGTPCNVGTRDMCINGICKVSRSSNALFSIILSGVMSNLCFAGICCFHFLTGTGSRFIQNCVTYPPNCKVWYPRIYDLIGKKRVPPSVKWYNFIT